MRSSLPQPRRLFLAGLVGALLLPTLILVSSAEAKSNTPPLLLERRAQEADAPLGYRIYGAADAPETLVLCPGAFYNSNQYAFLLRALESSPHRGRFKVVVFDYPGIGLSSNIHGLGPDASPRKLAGLGTQLLTHLARTGEIGRKEKVHLYGLSLGALVALGMAGEAPDMIDTVYAAQGPSPNLLATSEQLRSVREGMVSWTRTTSASCRRIPTVSESTWKARC